MQTTLFEFLKSIGFELEPFTYAEYEVIIGAITTSQGFPSGFKEGNIRHAYAVLSRNAIRRYWRFQLLYEWETNEGRLYLYHYIVEIMFRLFPKFMGIVRSFQILGSDFFDNVENWGFISDNSGNNISNYQGDDGVDTPFNKNTSTNLNKSGDKMDMVLKFELITSDFVKEFGRELEPILQTIYLPY